MFTYYKDSEDIVYAYEADQTPAPGLTEITEAEKDQLLLAQEAARVESLPYDVRRRREYPPVEEYLDAVVKGDQAQLESYVAACLAVKAKYPKP